MPRPANPAILPAFQPLDSPFRFCREIIEAGGHACLLFQYMAVVLGQKPLLDDWVPRNRLEDFRRACRRYGLFVRADIQFAMIDKQDVPASVIGRESITSTSAFGLPMAASHGRAQAHVFVSRRRSLLDHGMWYPVIVRGRLLRAPYADLLRFGVDLGYPPCCIRFFRFKNDWTRYSHLFEAFKNTPGRPRAVCNPLLKDTSPGYIYHMPCSYSCPATVRAASALRAAIFAREPGLARRADRALRGVFLVLYERDALRFDGRLSGGELRYRAAARLRPAPRRDGLLEALRRCDGLRIRGRVLELLREGAVRERRRVPLSPVAPRFMFLIDFSGRRP